MKKTNNLFGWGLLIVGVAKIVIVVIAIFLMFSIISSIFEGGDYSYVSTLLKYSIASELIGGVQLVLAICSVVMLIICFIKCPKVAGGYAIGIGAYCFNLFSEMFFSGLWLLIMIACVGVMYIKAGNKIREDNEKYVKDAKKTTNYLNNTKWFYDKEISNPKLQKKIEKLNDEINEWKQLFDMGEIDENTYNEEKNKLVQRIEQLQG